MIGRQRVMPTFNGSLQDNRYQTRFEALNNTSYGADSRASTGKTLWVEKLSGTLSALSPR